MTKELLISIIMPAYNSEKYLKDSIVSVINQTYHNWELIIIDDSSQDETAKIVKILAERDRRIIYFRNSENKGVSESRNFGITLSKGEWIAFLDSDDLWEERKLEKQIKLANEKQGEFIFTGASYINEKSQYYSGVFQVPHELSYKKLRKHNVISCSSVLVKKRFFEDIKMENDEMHEDFAVWLRILKLGIVAYGINEPLLIYRISKNSKSGNKIKTIKMTYQVFRFVGINHIGSAYFMLRHVFASVKKYRKIFSN